MKRSVSPPSPCVGICRLLPKTRVCAGCGRTTTEIEQWRDADVAEREEIVAAARRRLEAATADASAGVSEANALFKNAESD